MFVNLQNLHLYDFRDFDTADLIIKATRMFASSYLTKGRIIRKV